MKVDTFLNAMVQSITGRSTLSVCGALDICGNDRADAAESISIRAWSRNSDAIEAFQTATDDLGNATKFQNALRLALTQLTAWNAATVAWSSLQQALAREDGAEHYGWLISAESDLRHNAELTRAWETTWEAACLMLTANFGLPSMPDFYGRQFQRILVLSTTEQQARCRTIAGSGELFDRRKALVGSVLGVDWEEVPDAAIRDWDGCCKDCLLGTHAYRVPD